MEWVKPIDQVELELRRQGVFMLVDVRGKKLWFFQHSKDDIGIKRTMESLKGRGDEMIKFLIERASVRKRGETE